MFFFSLVDSPVDKYKKRLALDGEELIEQLKMDELVKLLDRVAIELELIGFVEGDNI